MSALLDAPITPSSPATQTEEKVLSLTLPDWGKFDNIRKSREPFALWRVGDQPLLYHWLDYAINEGYTRIDLFCSDRPAQIREAMHQATLWPIAWNLFPLAWEKESENFANRLPWGWAEMDSPKDGWDVLNHWMELEREWADQTYFHTDEADLNLAVGKHYNIHPSAKLEMPCWIGDNVFIGPGCEIGPNVSIGHGCVLGGHNRVVNSRIEDNTFLGAHTELDQCVLDGAMLINLKHEAVIPETDAVIACSTVAPKKPSLGERLESLGLWCRYKCRDFFSKQSLGIAKTFKTWNDLELTVYEGAPLWKQRLPWLLEAAKGNMFLYGVLPRTKEQMENADDEWQDILSNAPMGVFSYADTHGSHSPEDPMEALHAVFQATAPESEMREICQRFVANLK